MIAFCLLFTLTAQTGDEAANRQAFQRTMAVFGKAGDVSFGALVLQIANGFLGAPYRAGTLEGPGPEALVVDLRAFDCFTFTESVLALTRAARATPPRFEDFKAELQGLRYRDGTIDGYPSRLHYTSDWGFENAKAGALKDVTASLGGLPYEKRIDFMSKHRGAYAALADDAFAGRIADAERAINQRAHFYLPEALVPQKENSIQDGDVLALTTSIDGLDIAHVGLAIHRGGRLHMLHASSASQRVEVTAEPLAEYLESLPTRTGIMVFRPLPPTTP